MNDESRQPQRADLVAAAKEGSNAAQAELVQLLSPLLQRFFQGKAGAHLRRHLSLDDLLQESFMRAFRALDELPQGLDLDDFRKLLYRHAHWVVLSRGKSAQGFLPESVVAQGGNPVQQDRPGGTGDSDAGPRTGEVTLADEMRWLEERVDDLEDKYAAVVRLFLSGASFEEIAQRLDLSEAAARKRFLRASQMLQQSADTRRRLEER